MLDREIETTKGNMQMSAFSGRQGTGAMVAHRAAKKAEAEARNAVTKPERRKAARKAAAK